jgi:hypothetical protein
MNNNDEHDIQLQHILMMLVQEENKKQNTFQEDDNIFPNNVDNSSKNSINKSENISDNNSSNTSKNLNKCGHCNKKLSLLKFECRCGFNYCNIHRTPETHKCQFDYKTHERKLLEKNNQKIVKDKLERI